MNLVSALTSHWTKLTTLLLKTAKNKKSNNVRLAVSVILILMRSQIKIPIHVHIKINIVQIEKLFKNAKICLSHSVI